MLQMLYILAGDPPPALAAWGQIAAIYLVLQLFLLVVIGLALRGALAFIVSWMREKVELVKKVQPVVDSINTTTEAAMKGTPPAELTQNKVVQVVAQVPAQARSIEEKVEKGSDRVAGAVIEFRARTVMVQGILKAFFLPGLTRRQVQTQAPLKELGPGYGSPGLRKLMEEAAPEVPVEGEHGDGYTQAVSSGQLRDAPAH